VTQRARTARRNVAQDGSSVEQHAEREIRRASPWIERLARVLYVVYVLVGVLSVQAALGGGDRATRQEGALETLARQPFGPYILGTVALGLAAYGAFMFVVARYCRIEPA
jgi:hypothetical protein